MHHVPDGGDQLGFFIINKRSYIFAKKGKGRVGL